MAYEINVTLNDFHLFATAERSLTTEAQAKALWDVLVVKFPRSEGYAMKCTKWENRGQQMGWVHE